MTYFPIRTLHPLRIFSVLSGTVLAFFPLVASALPAWDAPEKVSQGHAFVITGTDTAPFSAEIQWRGKSIPVKARPMKEAGQWTADVMLAVPHDEVKDQRLTIRSTDSAGKKETVSRTVKPLKVAWIEQQLSVEPKYVTPPKAARNKTKGSRAQQRGSFPPFLPIPHGNCRSRGRSRVR